MQINKAEFVMSAVKYSAFPEHNSVEFMFCGRSNVGKSSFINMLCNRKNLAKTSSNPGKTQTLNIYRINDFFYFVDVPGYGYANISKSIQKKFGDMVENYIRRSPHLKMVFLLIDYRHPPTEDDITMYEYLKYYRLPVSIILTKADKLKRGEREINKKRIIKDLNVDPMDHVYVTSGETREGKEEVLEKIFEIVTA